MQGQQVFLFIVGTAGSGKTSLTHAFSEWLDERGVDVVTMNLDPGVEYLPYTPEIDVRDWIKVGEVMDKYGVGPNGAQILSADLLAVNFNEIKDVLDSYRSQYVIVDTPGQMELFAYRQSSRVVLDALGPTNSMLTYLFDPVLSSTPTGYVSLLMLAASIQFRFPTPFLNILSKSDVLEEEKLDDILKWSSDPSSLYDMLISSGEGAYKELNIEFFRALEGIGFTGQLVPVSSKTYFGMEDIYNTIQQTFFAGEDVGPD